MGWLVLCKAVSKNREAHEEREVNGKNKPRLEVGIASLVAWRFNILSMPAAAAESPAQHLAGRAVLQRAPGLEYGFLPRRKMDWPDANDVAKLPENHRRVVAAVLRHLERRLATLAMEGRARVPSDDLDVLRALGDVAQGRPQQTNARSLLAALQVLADDVEPRRLAGYGKLTGEQEATLRSLAESIRGLLNEIEIEPS